MDFLTELKSRTDIVDVLQRNGIELKKAGRVYKACCPFHHEKSASFIINPERQFAYCFGCHAHGDAITMAEKLEGLSFKDAVKTLAERAGLTVPADFGGGQAGDRKKTLLDIHEDTTAFFQHALTQHAEAREYLIKRGLTQSTIEHFRIGFAPAGNLLTQHLTTRGYSVHDISDAGVAFLRDMGGSSLKDRFQSRITFPIADREGRIIAFTARILGTGEPKYLNSPDTPLYSKGAVLFALDKAREAIRHKGYALIVEGQMDAISCHQAGLTETIATSGTAFTDTQAHLLSRLTSEVRICTDADRAGVESAKKISALLAAVDITSRFVLLPDGIKDPDEALQHEDDFKQRIAHPASLLAFYQARVFPGLSVKEQAAELLTAASHFASPIDRDALIKDAASALNLREDTLREEYSRLFSSKRTPQKHTPTVPTPAPITSSKKDEDRLLALLLITPPLRDTLAGDLPPDLLSRLGQPVSAESEALIMRITAETDTWTAEKKLSEAKELLTRITGREKTLTKKELLAQLVAAEHAGNTELATSLLARYQQAAG